MPWYAGLTPLRNALAELFPNATTATVVIYDAEIDPSLLDLDGAPLEIWQNVLSEAWKQTKIDTLIKVAQQRYPAYEPLRAAIAHYRATPTPPLLDLSRSATLGRLSNAQREASSPTTVNDCSHHTVFDQRGQTILGPQTNVAGNVHNSSDLFNGGPLRSDALSRPTNLAAELHKLLTQITLAGQQDLLDDITTIDVESSLRKAIVLASRPTPDRQSILVHLIATQAAINTFLKGADYSTLADAIANVIARIRQQLF